MTWLSVHANAAVTSAPDRGCSTTDTDAAPTSAHVAGRPSWVMDHKIDAEPRAAMSEPQLSQARTTASANSAAIGQRNVDFMTYYFLGWHEGDQWLWVSRLAPRDHRAE